MPEQTKQINFTIVPAEEQSAAPRTYSNFCSIAHTPFDFTLTFCEVMPLSDKEIKSGNVTLAMSQSANACSRPACPFSGESRATHTTSFAPGDRTPGGGQNRRARAVRPEPCRGAAGALARFLRVVQQRGLEQGGGARSLSPPSIRCDEERHGHRTHPRQGGSAAP